MKKFLLLLLVCFLPLLALGQGISMRSTNSQGYGTFTLTGPSGAQFKWIPSKHSIRGGKVTGTQWDTANIGTNSVAFGEDNLAAANDSVVAGGIDNSIGADSVYSVISGGEDNVIGIDTPGAVIAGGERNVIETRADYASISGGTNNTIGELADFTWIGGGEQNKIWQQADWAVIGGGFTNVVGEGSIYGTIGGGGDNGIGNTCSSSGIFCGQHNHILDGCNQSVIGGGYYNRLTGDYSTIPGGWMNNVNADHATAIGSRQTNSTARSVRIGTTNTVYISVTHTNIELVGPLSLNADTFYVGTLVLTNVDGSAFTNLTLPLLTNSIQFTVDGGGSTVTTGSKGPIAPMDCDGTIIGWSITAVGSSPTCTWDVWNIAAGTALPTVANTIMGTKPALVTGNNVTSTTLTGWDTTFTKNSIFGFNIDAVANGTKYILKLTYTHAQ